MKPLLDLNPRDCRWPVTADKPFLFCGEPQADGSSYCRCHQRMSVSAEQPAVYEGVVLSRMANAFGGGKARVRDPRIAEQRQPVDVVMSLAPTRPLTHDFFPEAAE